MTFSYCRWCGKEGYSHDKPFFCSNWCKEDWYDKQELITSKD